MNVIQFKGFEIHASPYQVTDSGEWKVNLRIMACSRCKCRAPIARQKPSVRQLGGR